MPDLTIEYARWCASNEYWETSVEGSKGKIYHIQFDNRSGWSCDCPAFKFGKGKSCKHIKQVEGRRCGYGWEAAAGSPIEMGKTCPQCGGETRIMRYAV